MTTPTVTQTGVAGVQDAGATTAESTAFTPSGSNRGGITYIQSSDGSPAAPSAVRWGGSGGTLMSQIGTTASFGTYFRGSLWYLNAEPAASSTTVHVTWGANQGERLIIAASLQDMDQTTRFRTPSQATGSSNTAAVTGISAQATDLILDFAGLGDVTAIGCHFIPGASQTEVVEVQIAPTVYDVAALCRLNSTGTSQNRSQLLREADNTTPVSLPWCIFGVAAIEFVGAAAARPIFPNAVLAAAMRASNF